MTSLIPEENFKTAKGFVDELRITNQRWISEQKPWETSWVFRGQADANLQLLPSAWRIPSLDWRIPNLERFKQKYRIKFEPIVEMEEIAKQVQQEEITEEEANIRSLQMHRSSELNLQYFVEMQAVKEFIEFAQKLGYPVPVSNEFIDLRHHHRNFRDLSEETYLISVFKLWTLHSDPYKVDCFAVALAQHHGVSTRLLDWTENPLVAAFFAAEKFTPDHYTGKDFNLDEDRIAVWAISKEIFSNNEYDSVTPSAIQLITRPRHEISYLSAQEAVFSHDKLANKLFIETGKWRSVEEAIGNNPKYLKKLTLPVSQVGELLRLLWLEGISRAHLMPTYDNISRALQMKAWWENK